MITLDEFLREPPCDLHRFAAYPVATIDRASACRELLAEIGRMSPDPSVFAAAILVGCDAGHALATVREALPGVGPILVLEPDPHMLRTMQLALAGEAARPTPTPETLLGDVCGPAVSYSFGAYLEASRFMTARRIRPREVLVSVHHGSIQRAPRLYEPVVHAIDDLFWSESARFVELLASLDGSAVATLEPWANFLADSAHPLAALRFYHALRGAVAPARLARRAIACAATLSALDLVADWVPYQGEGRAEVEHALAEATLAQAAARREVRERNLAILATTHPELHAKLLAHVPDGKLTVALVPSAPWVLSPECEVKVQADEYAALLDVDGGRLAFVNPIGNPDETIAATQVRTSFVRSSSFLVGSLGRYDVLLNLQRNRFVMPVPNCDQVIYVVEERLDVLYQLLGVTDLTWTFESPRIKWFVGPGAGDAFVRFLEASSMLQVPALRFGVSQSLAARLAALEARTEALTRALNAEVLGAYRESFAGEAARVLASRDRPLRILFHTSRFTDVLQHCVRDLRQAFGQLGCVSDVCVEQSPFERSTILALLGKVKAFRPDVMFLLDHIRPEYGTQLPPELPVVCWMQDELTSLSCPEMIRALGPRDFTFALSSWWTDKYRRLGYPHVAYLPNAANTEIYRPQDPTPPLRDQVAVVTTLAALRPEPSSLRGLHAVLERRLWQRGIGFQDHEFYRGILEESLAELGLTLAAEEFANQLLWLQTDFERWFSRRRTLTWLVEAGIPVALYGSGWDLEPRFRELARGRLDPGPDLARVYQESKVVLHVNEVYNCHQRVFECLAAGGFILALANPIDDAPGELHSCLRPGEEICTFSSRDELVALVHRAFSDEIWRRGVADAGRRRVLAEHSYVQRAETVLGVLRERVVQEGAARSA